MKRSPRSLAFTLIEMLTVMAVIAVLASLIMAVNGFVQRKAASERVNGEMAALSTGCENYKVDNGIFPRNDDTDSLDPRTQGNPTSGAYQKASLYLYKALSGDTSPDEAPDFQPEEKTYLPEFFKPNVLNARKDDSGRIKGVNYIQDPFGNSYGYSTAAAKAEEDYIKALKAKPNTERPTGTKGYNSAKFDLWSTGGSVKSPATEQDQARWIKNW
jgi:prepilin-type N-terminal cleavage/methylation domain-containing protein